MECCGKDRATAFCPECGKMLRKPSGLTGLLVHCRSQAERYRKEHERDVNNECSAKMIGRNKKNHERWDGWARDLAELMSRAAE